MPVYLLTIHAYRSWSESDPRGYVQRGEGLKPTSPRLAKARAMAARSVPVRFDAEDQRRAHAWAIEQCAACGWTLHACATTPTHVHLLASFRDPACECATLRYCHSKCPAYRYARRRMGIMKRRLGLTLAQSHGTMGRPYLSRGNDVTPVRNATHFDHLCSEYLPQHATKEAGIFQSYP